MESSISYSGSGNGWQIVPANTLAGLVLVALILYFLLRHFLFTLMLMDLVLGWLRQFRWFPGEGKRVRSFVHMIIAVGLLGGYAAAGGAFGWFEFVPK